VHDDIFDRISIRKLTESYLQEGEERIELAGFQRDAVWKAKNVETLWDSILCWYPIGSLTLARLDEFAEVGHKGPQLSTSGNLSLASMEIPTRDIYILIDGQQRSNALVLGMLLWSHPKALESGGRLWLDLGETTDKGDLRFKFYLCTSHDPFGEDVTVADKRRGFNSLGLSGTDDSEIQLSESYPVKAQVPVPFAEFVTLVWKLSSWSQIHDCMVTDNQFNVSDDTYEIVRGQLNGRPIRSDIDFLIQAIREVIVEEKYQIPLILFHKREGQVSSKHLFKLFERININGVTPPQSEMFYSVLKLQWPEAGNYVADVSRDPVLKDLNKPTDILLMALKLIKPNLDLTLASFATISDEEKLLMLGLLGRKSNGISIFHQCMRLLYDALHYRGTGDYGLPRQLISRIRKRVWQLSLIWTYQHLDELKEGIPEEHRKNLVQFALMDLLDYYLFRFQYNRRGYYRIINDPRFYREFLMLIDHSSDIPIRLLMSKAMEIAKYEAPIEIMTPSAYHEWISSPINGSLINWNSHRKGDVFLLYSQRDYLSKWESLDDIDKDHIIPQSWMDFTGPTVRTKFWLVETIDHNGRGPILHSPGNLRFWPASLNRQYHDKPPSSKYIHKQKDTSLDAFHQERDMMTVDDLLQASVVDSTLLDLLQAIEQKKGGDKRYWTTDQYMLIKQFTELRCKKMYTDLYESASFQQI